MSDKSVCRGFSYMTCGGMLLDILKNRNLDYFNAEFVRRFYIGILTDISEKSRPENKADKFVKKNKKFLSNPFVCGYALCLYLADKDLSMTEEQMSVIWEKYNLRLPYYRPFFDTNVKNVDMYPYVINYNKLNEKVKELEKTSNPAVNISEIESKLATHACHFFNKYLNENMKEDAESSSKRWSAEPLKMKYYSQRWSELCQIAAEGNVNLELSLETYFDALKLELKNISKESDKNKKGRNKDEQWIVYLPFLTTISNAGALSAEQLSNQENLSIFLSIFSIFSTVCSALLIVRNLLKKYHAYEETWLRHQLNYSRLTAEIEEFCEGIGKYEVSNSSPKTVMKNIQRFQKEIASLRKLDYSNFFINMNCINYKIEENNIKTENNQSEQTEDTQEIQMEHNQGGKPEDTQETQIESSQSEQTEDTQEIQIESNQGEQIENTQETQIESNQGEQTENIN